MCGLIFYWHDVNSLFRINFFLQSFLLSPQGIKWWIGCAVNQSADLGYKNNSSNVPVSILNKSNCDNELSLRSAVNEAQG